MTNKNGRAIILIARPSIERRNINMTGTLITKQSTSGQSYYYIKLSYKDPVSHKWRQKMISTHLEAKGNKRKAEALKNEAVANYSYL